MNKLMKINMYLADLRIRLETAENILKLPADYMEGLYEVSDEILKKAEELKNVIILE